MQIQAEGELRRRHEGALQAEELDGHNETQARTYQREQHALGEQLPNDSEACRSQR